VKDELDRYQFRKPATALRLIQLFSNWPVAFRLWLCKLRSGAHPTRVLKMRSGPVFACREGTSDWNTLMEVLVADEYMLAFDYIGSLPLRPIVIDLGANIGLFSLLCVNRNGSAMVDAYEPAPPNCDRFLENLSLNTSLGNRITLHQAAVGPAGGQAKLSYDENAPASANLYKAAGRRYDVPIVSLKDVLDRTPGRVQLLKIDIEGAEYDLLRDCEGDLWSKVDAIALELHDDPSREMSRDQFLSRMERLGFCAHKGPFISLLLTR
jgi:FkbM family methyltransferase